jgi:hypothetical protein
VVTENVEEIAMLESDFDQQQEPTEQRFANEGREDWIQRIAIERGYYDGSIPTKIAAPKDNQSEAQS